MQDEMFTAAWQVDAQGMARWLALRGGLINAIPVPPIPYSF